jgi:hypothetical protein
MARKAFPTPAVIAAAGMALLAAWGWVEYGERADPTLGGREPWTPPAWAVGDYLAMCRETRGCVRDYAEIRWFRVDADTLPTTICRKGREVQGCYDAMTGTITLAGRHVHDEILVRHELMHAALERIDPSAHPCKWFSFRRRTLWLGVPCEGGV